MGLDQACSLLRANGFDPAIIRGYGYLLQRSERLLFARSVRAVEKKLAEWNVAPSLALNFIIAAHPAQATNLSGP